MPRLRASLWLAFVATLVGGCSHYQLGTGATPGFRTLHLEPVANRTALPQAQTILSTQLREAFARDARTQIANSPAGADAVLAIAITSYRREVAAVREGDTGLARKFNVTLEAACTLRDTRSAKPIWDARPLSVTREVFTDGGQLQAEYQVLPLLAEALAAKILRSALDPW